MSSARTPSSLPRRRALRSAAGFLIGSAVFVSAGAAFAAGPTLLNVSYDVAREFY